MNLDALPRKTERAREALTDRAALPPNQRMFLIMVDGRKSLRDLAGPMSQLGIDARTLAAMSQAGLLRLSRPEGVCTPVAAPASRVSGFADDSAPSSVAPAEPERALARPAPSLAAVKLYAIDLMALMLPGQDGPLRESARRLTDPEGMRRWLHEATAQIAARASDERARLFMARVGDMLPPGFLERQAEPS